MPLADEEAIRAAFFKRYPVYALVARPNVPRKLRAEVCRAFCTFIDKLEHEGEITQELAVAASL